MQILELFLCLYFAIALRYLKSALEILTYEIFDSCTGEMIKIQIGMLWGLSGKKTYESGLTSAIASWMNECMILKKVNL